MTRRIGETGDSLIEILVALAIISMSLVVLIAALSTATFGVRTASQLTTATNLAAAQLETIKGVAYDPSGNYSLVAAPISYTVAIDAGEISAGLQQVTVTVSYAGEPLVTVSNYKVDR